MKDSAQCSQFDINSNNSKIVGMSKQVTRRATPPDSHQYVGSITDSPLSCSRGQILRIGHFSLTFP
jgi:hypothetical protein